MRKFQVFGGQYGWHHYGESDSMHGAKLIATANKEYWDNWKGWRVPEIFRAEDCVVDDRGVFPCRDAVPVAVCVNGKWQVVA